jgi:hypothetical protein
MRQGELVRVIFILSSRLYDESVFEECGLLRNEFGINDSRHLLSLPLLVRKAERSRLATR